MEEHKQSDCTTESPCPAGRPRNQSSTSSSQAYPDHDYDYLTTSPPAGRSLDRSYVNDTTARSANAENQTIYESLKKQQVSSTLNRRGLIILVVTIVALVVIVVALLAFFLTKKDKSGDSSTDSASCPALAFPCHKECDRGYCCDVGNDPSQCQKCAHAEAHVQPDTVCISSCAAIGAAVVNTLEGAEICQETLWQNLANPDVGTTCEADTIYNNDYKCENVMKDDTSEWNPADDGPGYAIQLNFDREYIVFSLEIKGRTARFSQCSEYELEFSGNQRERIYWTCQEGRALNKYFFNPKRTSFISVKCKVDCGQGGAQGFRRLWVYATV